MIREHGETYRRRLSVANWIYSKTIRFCVFHGEIELVNCGDWDAAHGACQEKAAALRQAEAADFDRKAQAQTLAVRG